MNRRRNRRQTKKGAATWYVTYSDMITLILVFFILLFSMSQLDRVKFDAVTESFQNRHILDFLPSAVPNDGSSESGEGQKAGGSENDLNDSLDSSIELEETETEEEKQEEETLDRLVENVESYLAENSLQDVITANRTERGVVLVLQDSIFFDMGEAEILDEGVPFLYEVGELLTQIPNDVKVEGHTDNRPIDTYRYPSNWELSGARASSVTRFLIEEFNFDESRFSIAGYGEMHPVVPNDSPDNMQLNRRVEITIINSRYEEKS